MKEDNLSFLLASSIHDMKNSIGLILHTIDSAASEEVDPETFKELIHTLRYEASRLNNDLLHLLGVYRYTESVLPINIDEHYIEEVLEDQFYRVEELLKSKNIELETTCDVDTWPVDAELIGGVISNVILNALRYTKHKIKLSATEEENHLVIRIEDDGAGFPEGMISDDGDEENLKPMDFNTGSTSLGIYFAKKVAKLHKNESKKGRIKLSNGGSLGGGVFEIYIP